MKLLIFAILFLLAFVERVFLDLGPNIELITMATLLAVAYLGTRSALMLIVLIMFTSDILLGNTSIFLFTWTGFLIPAVISGKIFQVVTTGSKIITGSLMGIGATLFFYLWTNFGVWLLDTWGMYSNDISGLLLSYINGLPFLKLHLSSTLVFVPVGFVVAEILRAIYPFLSKHARRFLSRDLLPVQA